MNTKLILTAIMAAAMGGTVGWFAPHHVAAAAASAATSATTTAERKVLYYVCPMHPKIKYDHPGNCPICGMKLQPVYADETASAPSFAPASCCSSGATP